MPRPIDPLSFAQRVQRMEPGQTIHFPLSDYVRTSIHVSLSRLRSEYKDLMGGTMLPCWSLDIPTPPGDLWAVTYHGLTEGGRVARPRLSEQEAKERRREAQSRSYYRRIANMAERMAERADADLRLRADAPLGLDDELGDALRQQIAQAEAAKAARRADLEARRAQPGYKPKPFVWNKSPAAVQAAEERDRIQAENRARKAAVRAAKEAERQRRLESRTRPPTATELKEAIDKLEVSLAFYQERQEQLEGRLEDAQDSQEKAKRPEQLSPEQQARVLRGEVSCRWDRAQNKIDEYTDRLHRYQTRIKKIEAEIQALKAARAGYPFTITNPKEIPR